MLNDTKYYTSISNSIEQLIINLSIMIDEYLFIFNDIGCIKVTRPVKSKLSLPAPMKENE